MSEKRSFSSFFHIRDGESSLREKEIAFRLRTDLLSLFVCMRIFGIARSVLDRSNAMLALGNAESYDRRAQEAATRRYFAFLF